MSARGIYPTRSAAGDVRAKTAEAKETDKILEAEGYPAVRYWTNNKIEDIFGRCSRQHHMLLAIQNFHANQKKRDASLAQWNAQPAGFQGCRPFREIGDPTLPYQKWLKHTCYCCKSTLSIPVYSSRLIAISRLGYSQLWKAVLPRKGAETQWIFEGSARCNGFGHKGHNHCMTPSHLNMETVKHNARRKTHHRGLARCYCYRLCVGKKVKADPDGGCCDSVFSGKTCKNFFGGRKIK